MAFLTLFRVSTGDNWNGIMKVRAHPSEVPPRAGPGDTAAHPEPRLLGKMNSLPHPLPPIQVHDLLSLGWKQSGTPSPQDSVECFLCPQDTLRDCDQESTCYNTVISPIYFVSFVLTAQFVLVNVVIAVLMKHLEESNKEAKEEAELEAELELEMKTLSPQPHSPLGSPFLWPGAEGPDSPKPTAAHAGAASRFSLEHPTVSKQQPLPRGGRGMGGQVAGDQVGGVRGVGQCGRPQGPAWGLLPLLLGCRGAGSPPPAPRPSCAHSQPRGHPSEPPACAGSSTPCVSSPAGVPLSALRSKAKFSVSFLFLSYPCPITKPLSFPLFHLPDSISQSFPDLRFPSPSLHLSSSHLRPPFSFLSHLSPLHPIPPPSPVSLCCCVCVCVHVLPLPLFPLVSLVNPSATTLPIVAPLNPAPLMGWSSPGQTAV